MDAMNAPIRRRRKEINTADLELGQKPPIVLPDEGPIDREQIIVPVDTEALNKDYLEALKFNEDAVTILIHPSREKNAPTSVQCWVNGKGAEVFLRGKWMALGYLPIGIPVITKRKYVEVLARSKTDTVDTVHDDATVERPRNMVNRITSANATFQIINDSNPRSAEWIQRVYATAD